MLHIHRAVGLIRPVEEGVDDQLTHGVLRIVEELQLDAAGDVERAERGMRFDQAEHALDTRKDRLLLPNPAGRFRAARRPVLKGITMSG